MNDQIAISFSMWSTDASCPLGVEVWLDEQILLDIDHIDKRVDFEHMLSDSPGQHELSILLKNKPKEFTKLDEQGNILQDAMLNVADMAFDGIPLGQILFDTAVYLHDQNGHLPAQVQDKFYGSMGCNGTMLLKFSTPMYLWFLENM